MASSLDTTNSMGSVSPLRYLGSKSSASLDSKRHSSGFPIYLSPVSPNTQVMTSGLVDLDNQMLPGGLPVDSIFGFLTPDPWLETPISHNLNSSYVIDGGPTHISNLIGVAFGAHGILIEDSAILIITGSHLLQNQSALSISTCYSIWPTIYTNEVVETEIKTETSIPLKIAWRYNTIKPTLNQSTNLTSENNNKSKSQTLDWTSSIVSNNGLFQKVKERIRVISLASTGDIGQINSMIKDFFVFISQNKFKTARIIIEDPFSPFSKICKSEELATICSLVKENKGIPLSILVFLPKRSKEIDVDISRILDGCVEIVYCPSEFLPKKSISIHNSQQYQSNALIRWMKPLRLPSSHANWSPPTSIGGVWQISLNRRKAITLLPVSFPVEEDTQHTSPLNNSNGLNFTTSCSDPINSW